MRVMFPPGTARRQRLGWGTPPPPRAGGARRVGGSRGARGGGGGCGGALSQAVTSIPRRLSAAMAGASPGGPWRGSRRRLRHSARRATPAAVRARLDRAAHVVCPEAHCPTRGSDAQATLARPAAATLTPQAEAEPDAPREPVRAAPEALGAPALERIERAQALEQARARGGDLGGEGGDLLLQGGERVGLRGEREHEHLPSSFRNSMAILRAREPAQARSLRRLPSDIEGPRAGRAWRGSGCVWARF